jgi:hypothetical protein
MQFFYYIIGIFLMHALGWSMTNDDDFKPILRWHSNSEALNGCHTDGVHEVLFSPDKTRIFTGSQRQKYLRLVHTGQVIKQVAGEKAKFSHDGQLLATIDHQIVRIYVTETGERAEPRGLYGHDGKIQSMTFFNNDHRVVTGSTDGEVKIWHADTGFCLNTVKILGPIRFIAVTRDDKKIIIADDATIRIFNAENGKLVRSINMGAEGYPFAYGLETKVAVFMARQISIFDIESGELEQNYASPKNCYSLAFAKSHAYLVGSFDDGIKVFSLGSKKAKVITPRNGLRAAIDRADSMLATSSYELESLGYGSNYDLKLWNPETGTEISALQTQGKSGIISLQFSDDGIFLAAGSDNQSCVVMLWILPSSELLNPPDNLAKRTFMTLIKEYKNQCKLSPESSSHAGFIAFIAEKLPESTVHTPAEYERIMFDQLDYNSRAYLEVLLPQKSNSSKL